MNKYLIIALLSSKIFAIDGYLYQNGISDCQDPCSQHFIESELYGDFETIPITFQNPNINIDLYMNRFVTVELGQEVTCVECNAFEVLDINLLKKNDPLYYGIIDGNMIKIQNYFLILYLN